MDIHVQHGSAPHIMSFAIMVKEEEAVISFSVRFACCLVLFGHQMYEAALLTRCYTQHALRPLIDAVINHQRHFIKTPFINKGIDFIDLPSIFQDKSVTSSIPENFQNPEPHIICYKYNKLIRHTIFNFNKLVSDLDIHANTPNS